ncbi:MAG: sulfurtransferase complex subunit TusC [Sulfuricaulis sp.]|uniref:sulfurtransferase complex subunit TusC n=1 Tax=Sulfuricaulis sp. TaxID=2003553 RepID=UPI0034A28557
MNESGTDTSTRIKKFLFVNRKAPYGTIYALEALEVVMISAAFDQDVSLAFLDDGIFQIVKGQETTFIGMKNFSQTYRALEDFGVTKLYVERESMEARGISGSDFIVPAEVISVREMAELMASQDIILSF